MVADLEGDCFVGGEDAQAGEEGMHDVLHAAWEYGKIVRFLSGVESDQLRYS